MREIYQLGRAEYMWGTVEETELGIRRTGRPTYYDLGELYVVLERRHPYTRVLMLRTLQAGWYKRSVPAREREKLNR